MFESIGIIQKSGLSHQKWLQHISKQYGLPSKISKTAPRIACLALRQSWNLCSGKETLAKQEPWLQDILDAMESFKDGSNPTVTEDRCFFVY